MIPSPPWASVSTEGQHGFTLVEVLAALAVASLIMASLNLASTAVRQGVEKTRQSLGSQAAVSAATGIFQRDAARIAKLRGAGRAEPDGYVFEGSARQVIYPLSEFEGVSQGGLYLVRLRAENAEGSTQLIRDRAPLLPGEQILEGRSWSDAVVLLEGPLDIGFAYRAQRTGGRDWNDSWDATNAMPEQIRLTIVDSATGRLRAPVIVQSLLVDAEIECAARPASCGDAQSKSAAP
jgi:prepilin-type N-terminal cleavage/methylation domain-containing protein